MKVYNNVEDYFNENFDRIQAQALERKKSSSYTIKYLDGEVWTGKDIENAPHQTNSSKIFHCKDGPAVVWMARGEIFQEAYFLNGERHRLDGVAIDNRMSPVNNGWYINGEYVEDPSFVARILKLKKKSSLVNYLLDKDSAIRYVAEYRLKELESLVDVETKY